MYVTCKSEIKCRFAVSVSQVYEGLRNGDRRDGSERSWSTVREDDQSHGKLLLRCHKNSYHSAIII